MGTRGKEAIMADLVRGVEIERKFVIKMPSVDYLMTLADYTKSEIEQIYLSAPEGVTRRVRRRASGDAVRYYETVKTRIDKMSVIEDEGEISAAEYESAKREILPGTSPIYKTRHTFTYEGLTIEIDIYDKWVKTCILECELPSREHPFALPPFIELVREVTGEKEFSNAGMARQFPAELA